MPAPRSVVLACLAALLLPGTVGLTAQTSISGTLSTDTTWALAQSPLLVTGPLSVAAGVTLTIDPGVVVQFATNTSLEVSGTLVARGTAVAPIRFTSETTPVEPGQWSHIGLFATSVDATYDGAGNYVAGSIIEHAVIEGGGSGSHAPIYVRQASPLIDSVTVRAREGWASWGIAATSANLRVRNSELDGGGIELHAGSLASDVRIEGNWIHDTYTAIKVDHNSAAATTLVRQNVLEDNGRGLDVEARGNGTSSF